MIQEHDDAARPVCPHLATRYVVTSLNSVGDSLVMSDWQVELDDVEVVLAVDKADGRFHSQPSALVDELGAVISEGESRDT